MPPCIVIVKLKTKFIFSWYAMSSSSLLELLSKVDLLLHFAETVLKSAKQLKNLIIESSSEEDDGIDLREEERGPVSYAGAEEGFDEEEAENCRNNSKKRKPSS